MARLGAKVVGLDASDQNIKVVRPGYGLKPKFYNNILGKISKIKISTGTAINWKMIK